jgi:hypothetical protein
VTAAEAVMKPRRENGATFVSPMTSDVSRGSALMMDFLRRVEARIQQRNATESKSPAREDRSWASGGIGALAHQQNACVNIPPKRIAGLLHSLQIE